MFVYPFCFPLSAGFNPRTHTGCGHVHLLHVASIFCFNPRTTQGSTFWAVPCIVIMLVSIHAPTQGATCTGTRQSMWAMCFNPRTHTGCDFEMDSRQHKKRCFNPRTHTGCDHAACTDTTTTDQFQSTHPHGVRLLSLAAVMTFAGFQSTHPHGVRQIVKHIHARNVSFNPRTHTGCDRQTISAQ